MIDFSVMAKYMRFIKTKDFHTGVVWFLTFSSLRLVAISGVVDLQWIGEVTTDKAFTPLNITENTLA